MIRRNLFNKKIIKKRSIQFPKNEYFIEQITSADIKKKMNIYANNGNIILVYWRLLNKGIKQPFVKVEFLNEYKDVFFTYRKYTRKNFWDVKIHLSHIDIWLNLYKLIYLNNYIFHSSGFIYKGKAYLFTGPSSYGKSTLLNKIESEVKVKCLDDDLNILFFKNGKLYVKNPKFYKDVYSFLKKKRKTVSAKVKAIYILNKNYKDKIKERINNPNKVINILKEQLHYKYKNKKNKKQVIEIIKRILATKVPIYHLSFELDKPILNRIIFK